LVAGPETGVFAYAAAQVKKAMEVTQRLGGENYVFWGGREVILFSHRTEKHGLSEQRSIFPLIFRTDKPFFLLFSHRTDRQW
jgi:xylose isomerase